MEVIYVDNHLFAAIKPSGISTQPHEENLESFLDQAKKWIKEKYKKPGNVFLEPVHRLDKPASGIVLFARTSKALSRMQEQMRDKKISKTYIAWIEGSLPSQEGTLEHFLLHGSHRAFVVPSSHEEAKRALLHFRLVRTDGEISLIEISLETGRYHQIRVQLSAVGCPIVGDRKYGSQHAWQKEGIALHHAKMIFIHPVTRVEIQLERSFN